MGRVIYIVAREQPSLCAYLKTTVGTRFPDGPHVEIKLDERRSERRLPGDVQQPERRKAERRRQPNHDRDLRSRGYATVVESEVIPSQSDLPSKGQHAGTDEGGSAPRAPFPTLADQRQYWDERWERSQDQGRRPWDRKRADVILAMFRSLNLPHPRILDMGCGTGWLTGELAQLGEATGVDLSEGAIAMARSRYPQATFFAGSVLDMRLPIAEIDVVVSVEVIAHVENQDLYMERVAQVLKPRAYLIITTANKFVHERTDWSPDHPAHIALWLDRPALHRLLTRHGFQVLKTTSVIPMGHRGIMKLVNSRKLNAALLNLFSESALEALKGWAGFGCTLVALARKLT
jgi:2-polyprenyl-3-methyl-5-hydroxy-6-metoxy-1,4-benzoquinol methylase